MTDRERYLYLLATGPLLKADAIVVLCGEDADTRMSVAAGLMASGGAPLAVLSGGVDRRPRWQGADAMRAKLMGSGVSPDRIVVEAESTNTREQAVNVVRLAKKRGWWRVLLVASAYHLPRAHLTFLKAVEEAGMTESLHVVGVPATHTNWFRCPDGVDHPRADLLAVELEKVDAYREKGHVASYADGLAYLRFWEGVQ